MTDRHQISEEQLGKEIGYLVGGRIEAVTAPAGIYLAIQDRLGKQDSGWSISGLFERMLPGGWPVRLNAGTIVKVTLGVIAAAAIITILIWQGRDSDQGLQPAGDPSSTPTPGPANDTGVPNLNNRFDLSDLDAATTEAEIIRLLGEGHVMYTRQTVMRKSTREPGGVFMSSSGCFSVARSIPQIVCEGYPETVVEEWWESVDSRGTVNAYFGRISTLEDIVLATGVQGEWTDIASGEKWSAGRREGRELVRDVGATFAIIEEMEAGYLVGTESEFAGRPSLVFPLADQYTGRPRVSFDGGDSEYQLANPFFQRVAYWHDDDDGTREMREETTVLDFAMLPPGSLPRFAVVPTPVELDVPNLSERADLEGMDTAAIQAEFIRLFAEGHVLYQRMERFRLGGAYNGLCGISAGPNPEMPQPVCDNYPGRIVWETWESPDSSGVVEVYISRMSKLDGTILAIKVQSVWTDIASGETWKDGIQEDRNLIDQFGSISTLIERFSENYPSFAESEYLGKPSIIFADVFEYQIQNPMLWRQVRRQELGDGMHTILSEVRFTDVAMLPPGSFPEFATAVVIATPVPAAPTATPVAATATPGPTAAFTVNDLDIEPKTGTVFETLLSKMPDNEATRGYTRLGDVAGVIDALGIKPLSPGYTEDELDEFSGEIASRGDPTSGISDGFYPPIFEWPAEQRDYASSVDTYPDLAFDWVSVDQFAQSNNYFNQFLEDTYVPRSYDVALGQFDPTATASALAQCDCDQPEIREHAGVEYYAWGEGDGRGDISRRNTRPFYDHIGRGPHLLVRDGETYYSYRDGVIGEHIEVIQGATSSLAEIDDYVSAVQWIASMGIVSEITLRNQGFTVDEVVGSMRGRITEEEVVQDQPLLLPFSSVATGIGFDGDRQFFALVIVHEDAALVDPNVDLLLARIRNVTSAEMHANLTDEWSFLVDQIDIRTSGRFLITRIYLDKPFYGVLLDMPNTLLLHE